MQEYNVIVEIDEEGNIKLETKGMTGEACVEVIDNILKDIGGKKDYKNKPEFYQKISNLKSGEYSKVY